MAKFKRFDSRNKKANRHKFKPIDQSNSDFNLKKYHKMKKEYQEIGIIEDPIYSLYEDIDSDDDDDDYV